MDLKVTSRVDAGEAVLSAAGSVDIASRDRLAAAAEDVLSRGGVSSLVIDLAGVTFMDSTGVGTLVELAGRMDDDEGSFHIRQPSRPVARVLEVSGLADQWLA